MMHPDDIQKLRWMYHVLRRGIRGKNVRATGDGYYIGGDDEGDLTPNEVWKPRQFLVQEVKDEYLVCVPYRLDKLESDDKQYNVARPPSPQMPAQVPLTPYPPYLPNETVIWAAPILFTGIVDEEEDPVVWMDINFEGRTSGFIPVQLTDAQGSAGVYNTSTPNYTYTVKDLNGEELATQKSPMIQRDRTPTTAGTYGIAYLDTGGEWQLLWANEEPDHSRGYYQLSGASPYGSGSASEIDNPNGKIEFAGRANSGEIPVYTEITDGTGTDVVTQYILESDIPGGGGGADGQGYESVTDGTTTLNKTDGGIIAFDTATPSVDELAVEFTVTNNDPTATVTGIVDVSGITGTGGPLGGGTTVYKLIVVEDTAGAGPHIIDSTDFSGRMIKIWVRNVLDTTAAAWAADTASAISGEANGGPNFRYVATADSDDFTVSSIPMGTLFTDQSDGYKLKLNLTSTPSTGLRHYCALKYEYGPRMTAADQTIS